MRRSRKFAAALGITAAAASAAVLGGPAHYQAADGITWSSPAPDTSSIGVSKVHSDEGTSDLGAITSLTWT